MSKKYEKVKNYYDKGLWNGSRRRNMSRSQGKYTQKMWMPDETDRKL